MAIAELWDASNTVKLADLDMVDDNGDPVEDAEGIPWGPAPGATAPRQVNQINTCKMALQVDHPARAHMKLGNVVRVYNGRGDARRQINAWFIEPVTEEVVSPNGRRQLHLAGRTLPSILERATEHPWQEDLAKEPQSGVKAYSWSARPYDVSGWSTTLHRQSRLGMIPHRPLGRVSPFCEPVWPLVESSDHPVEKVRAVREFSFTGTGPTDIGFFYTGDDNVRVYVNGELLDAQEPDHPNQVHGYTWKSGVVLDPGEVHRFGIEVDNFGLYGMFQAECWRTSGTVLDYPIFLSGIDPTNPSVLFMQDLDPVGWANPNAFVGTWRVHRSSTGPPIGMTFGAISRLAVEAAQRHGQAQGLTLGYSDVEDSAGRPWPIIPWHAPQIDQTLWASWQPLRDAWVELDMADHGLQLLAYDKHTAAGMGEHTDDQFVAGTNLRTLSKTWGVAV